MCVLVCKRIGGEVGAVETVWALPWGVFVDRSKVVLLLCLCFFLSCVCSAFARVCLFVPYGRLLGEG